MGLGSLPYPSPSEEAIRPPDLAFASSIPADRSRFKEITDTDITLYFHSAFFLSHFISMLTHLFLQYPYEIDVEQLKF